MRRYAEGDKVSMNVGYYYMANAMGRLTAVPGYATGAPSDLTLVSLTALSTALDTMNKTVGTNEAALAGARGARLAAYKAADTGLRAKMQSIKQATKSQYGVRSVAFRQIKGIRW